MSRLKCFCLFFLLLFVTRLKAQNGPTLPDVRPYAPVHGTSLENVSQTNGSLNLHIPLWSVKQRGKLKVDYWLGYYSPSFTLNFECDNASHPSQDSCNSYYPQCPPAGANSNWQLCDSDWVISGGGIWENIYGVYVASSLDYAVQSRQLYSHNAGGVEAGPKYWQIADPYGANHRLVLVAGTQYRSADGSGYLYDSGSCTLRTNDGTIYQFGCTSSTDSLGNAPGYLQTVRDTNGNQITFPQSNTAVRPYVDTLGNTITGFQDVPPEGACPAGSINEQRWTPPGVSNPIVICYGAVNYRTGFFNGLGYPDFDDGYRENQEAVGSISPISQVTLPTGEIYRFDYNDGGRAQLSRLTLPTGGYISYDWLETTGPICGITQGGGAYVTGVRTRSVSESANAAPAVWQYLISAVGSPEYQNGKITDPYGNTTEITFTSPDAYTTASGCARYPQTQTSKDASGATLKTVTTEYQWYPSRLLDQDYTASDPLVLEGLPISVTTAWADGRAKKTTMTYDGGFNAVSMNGDSVVVPYGNKVSSTEYGYGSGGVGGAVITESTIYKAFGDGSFLYPSNLLDALDSTSEVDSLSGATRAKTFTYDDAARGNVTGISQHLDTTNTDLQTTYGYTPYGLVNLMTSPQDAVTPSTTTTSTYSSSYGSAVPTSIKDALNHETAIAYDSASLRVTSTTDPNGQTVQYTYFGDGRLRQIIYPDGGEHDYAYPNANEVDETIKLDPGRSLVTKLYYDGLGRKVKTATQGGCADGTDVIVSTVYDLMDRVRSTTSPHCGTASVPTTYYGSADGAQPGYDALGRPVLLTNPDGSTRTWSYNDRSIDSVQDSVTVTDEGGNRTTQIADALGHQVGVVEAGGQRTTYSMNAFGELTHVSQAGAVGEQARTRHLVYDSLGCLRFSTNPETGTISYGYDNHGNLIAKTDARGILTTISYDALNRPTYRGYSDGTRLQWLTYDGQGLSGWRAGAQWLSNAVGHLTQTSDGIAIGSAFAYDAMGRLVLKEDATDSVVVDTHATYNLAGTRLR